MASKLEFKHKVPVALLPSINSIPMSLSWAKQPFSVQCNHEKDNTDIAQPSVALARTCFCKITLTLQNSMLFNLEMKLPPLKHATQGNSSQLWSDDMVREEARTRERLSESCWEEMGEKKARWWQCTYIISSYNCIAFICQEVSNEHSKYPMLLLQ